jgi:hypothetical protein
MASSMNKIVAKVTFKNNNERTLEGRIEEANKRDINKGTTPG